jgi:hypothetical protein
LNNIGYQFSELQMMTMENELKGRPRRSSWTKIK